MRGKTAAGRQGATPRKPLDAVRRSELVCAVARLLVEDARRPQDRALPPGATPEHGAPVVGRLHLREVAEDGAAEGEEGRGPGIQEREGAGGASRPSQAGVMGSQTDKFHSPPDSPSSSRGSR